MVLLLQLYGQTGVSWHFCFSRAGPIVAPVEKSSSVGHVPRPSVGCGSGTTLSHNLVMDLPWRYGI